jgi:vancomycin resistance protein YoaR
MTRAGKKAFYVAALALPLLASVAAAGWIWRLPGDERVIASFSTSLRGRTRSQTFNVSLALAALNGAVIAPGQEFSFNRAVGPWTVDRGYRKAPVSYSGERALDWGGGVCQASTTLYNAALVAGLPIRERHRHFWPARYVPPGQDAAVAYPNIDLRFRNSLDRPLRIAARVEGESVVVELRSRARPPGAHLEREVLAVVAPLTLARLRPDAPRAGLSRGQPGYEVAVYRVFADGGRRELVSRDSYPAQNRIVWR